MAALTGKLTDQTPSVPFTPTEGVSDVVVLINKPGQCFLEALAPGFTQSALVTIASGSFSVMTPDPAVTYTFRSDSADVDIDYYMGP